MVLYWCANPLIQFAGTWKIDEQQIKKLKKNEANKDIPLNWRRTVYFYSHK